MGCGVGVVTWVLCSQEWVWCGCGVGAVTWVLCSQEWVWCGRGVGAVTSVMCSFRSECGVGVVWVR